MIHRSTLTIMNQTGNETNPKLTRSESSRLQKIHNSGLRPIQEATPNENARLWINEETRANLEGEAETTSLIEERPKNYFKVKVSAFRVVEKQQKPQQEPAKSQFNDDLSSSSSSSYKMTTTTTNSSSPSSSLASDESDIIHNPIFNSNSTESSIFARNTKSGFISSSAPIQQQQQQQLRNVETSNSTNTRNNCSTFRPRREDQQLNEERPRRETVTSSRNILCLGRINNNNKITNNSDDFYYCDCINHHRISSANKIKPPPQNEQTTTNCLGVEKCTNKRTAVLNLNPYLAISTSDNTTSLRPNYENKEIVLERENDKRLTLIRSNSCQANSNDNQNRQFKSTISTNNNNNNNNNKSTHINQGRVQQRRYRHLTTLIANINQQQEKEDEEVVIEPSKISNFKDDLILLESRERCEDENEYSSSSTATTTTTETSSSSYLDGFLNSLDEISKYLEKKCARVREQFQPDEISQSDLSITSTKASTDFYPYTPAKNSNPPLNNNNTQQIASNRRPRGARFATQPIHFIRSTFDDHFVNSSNIHSQKLFDAGNKEIIDLTNTNNTTSNTNRQNWSKSNESEHPLQQVANSNKMTSNNYSPTSSKQMAPVAPTNKNYISLSDILNNNSNANNTNTMLDAKSSSSPSKTSPNNTITTTTTPTKVALSTLMKQSANNTTPNTSTLTKQATTTTIKNKQQTVEKLFDDLKLDCDVEHLRQLDRLERARMELELVQARIVDEIKSSWISSNNNNNNNTIKRKLKSTRQKRKQPNKVAAKKRSSTLIDGRVRTTTRRRRRRRKFSGCQSRPSRYWLIELMVTSVRRCFIAFRFVVVKNSFEFKFPIADWNNYFSNEPIFSNPNQVRTRFRVIPASYRKLMRLKEDAAQVYNLPRIEVRKETSNSKNSNRLSGDSAVSNSEDNERSKSKQTVDNTSDCSSSSVSLTQSPVMMLSTVNSDSSLLLRRKQELKLIGNEQNSNSASSKQLATNNLFNKEMNQESTLHERRMQKNFEFLNFIDAAKWLIEAGYSQLVYSFLKERCRSTNDETTPETSIPEFDLEKCIESIKRDSQSLQECDIKAIRRRLEILHSSTTSTSSCLNIDYKYLIENYLNFNDEDELEDEDEEYDEETTTTNNNNNNNNTTNSPQTSSKTSTTTTKPVTTTPKIETTDESYNLENDVDLIDIGADEDDQEITKQTRKPIIFENEEQEEDNQTRALEPLYLDNLTSTSSANISSSGSSGTNQTSSSSTSSSAKIMSSSSSTNKKDQDLVISPLTPNKFICIQFPLNSESTIVEEKSTPSSNSVKSKTKAMSPQPANAPQPHGIVLNRFHSFRLDDKLLNHTFNKPSQLLISDEASKTNIANNKSDNITTRSNLDLSNDSQINLPSSQPHHNHPQQSSLIIKSTGVGEVTTKSVEKRAQNQQQRGKTAQTATVTPSTSSKYHSSSISSDRGVRDSGESSPLSSNSSSAASSSEEHESSSVNSPQSISSPATATVTSKPPPLIKQKFRNATMVIPWRKSIKRGHNVSKRAKDDLEAVKKAAAAAAAAARAIPNIDDDGDDDDEDDDDDDVDDDDNLGYEDDEEDNNEPTSTASNDAHHLPKIELVAAASSSILTSSQANLNLLSPQGSSAHHVIDLNNNNAATTTSSSNSVTVAANSKRERRDSGVGGSLSREIGRRREKWNSFVKSHRPSFKSSKLLINSLSVKQYSKLKKFSLVRITALMEQYSMTSQKSSWTRFKTMPKFMKRSANHQKSIDQSQYKNKLVFGVPLKVNFQRHGQPLPQAIIQIMKYLRKNALHTVGIFRKSGSRSRMSLIREHIERTNTFDMDDIERLFSLVGTPTSTTSGGGAISNDLNSIGSGFSSQSTSKSDLVDELTTSSSQSATATAASSGISSETTAMAKQMVNAELIAIDLADILKQYFRELPECLFTNKLSQTLIDIFTFFPENERLEALQYCMLLLDDENRDAIQCLLYFLHDIAKNSQVHKMDVRNIAICLAPTLLNLNNLKEINPSVLSGLTSIGLNSVGSQSPTSPLSQLQQQQQMRDTTQMMQRQCNASLDCLTLMIEQPKRIFQIPSEAYTKCQFTKMDYSISLTLSELLGNYSVQTLNLFLNDRIAEAYKEAMRDKARNWTRLRTKDSSHASSCVEIFFKLIEDDDYHLRLWKLSLEIDAQPVDVLNKLLKFRSQWDEDLIDMKVIENLTNQTDVVQYVMNLMPPQPTRDFCELRHWRDATYLNPKYAYLIYSTSIEHEKAMLVGDIRANTLRNFYLIESIGENKCKLHQLFRADYMGYSSEWYNKMQAHFLKRYLVNLKECLRKK